jgi:hypothetical protein
MPYVYVARRSDGKIKVGYSTRPRLRMDELRTQFGMAFTLIRTWKHDRAVNVETVAHRLLVELRDPKSQGIETYDADAKAVIAAIKEAIWRFDRGILRSVPTRPWTRRYAPFVSPEETAHAVKEWLLSIGITDERSPEAFAAADMWGKS